MKRGFDKFNAVDCLKTNIKTSILFMATLLISISIDFIIFKITFNTMKNLDNGFADLALIVMFLLFTLALLVTCSVVSIIKMKLYEGFIDNIKSLIGLGVCNILIMVFLYKSTTPLLAIIYIGIVFCLCVIAFAMRYLRIISNENRGAKCDKD